MRPIAEWLDGVGPVEGSGFDGLLERYRAEVDPDATRWELLTRLVREAGVSVGAWGRPVQPDGWPERWPSLRPRREHRTQDEADALMAEAAGDCELDPRAPDRRNVVALLQACYMITGSTNLPRGWISSIGAELAGAGCRVPSATVLRWYRTKLAQDPGHFAPLLLPEVLADLSDWADR